MSETWEATRTGWRRLSTALREADEDTQYSFAFWAIGIFMIGGSIIIEFGWNGASFCVGFLLWRASNVHS